MKNIYHENGNSKNDSNSKVKYTCRFDIQIENDKDFQVTKKLIGFKGSNMKKILEEILLLLEDSV